MVQKLCEAVTERCELGSVRQRCQLLEQMVYQWRKRAQQLQKQVIDLLTVLSLCIKMSLQKLLLQIEFQLERTLREVIQLFQPQVAVVELQVLCKGTRIVQADSGSHFDSESRNKNEEIIPVNRLTQTGWIAPPTKDILCADWHQPSELESEPESACTTLCASWRRLSETELEPESACTMRLP